MIYTIRFICNLCPAPSDTLDVLMVGRKIFVLYGPLHLSFLFFSFPFSLSSLSLCLSFLFFSSRLPLLGFPPFIQHRQDVLVAPFRVAERIA